MQLKFYWGGSGPQFAFDASKPEFHPGTLEPWVLLAAVIGLPHWNPGCCKFCDFSSALELATVGASSSRSAVQGSHASTFAFLKRFLSPVQTTPATQQTTCATDRNSVADIG